MKPSMAGVFLASTLFLNGCGNDDNSSDPEVAQQVETSLEDASSILSTNRPLPPIDDSTTLASEQEQEKNEYECRLTRFQTGRYILGYDGKTLCDKGAGNKVYTKVNGTSYYGKDFEHKESGTLAYYIGSRWSNDFVAITDASYIKEFSFGVLYGKKGEQGLQGINFDGKPLSLSLENTVLGYEIYEVKSGNSTQFVTLKNETGDVKQLVGYAKVSSGTAMSYIYGAGCTFTSNDGEIIENVKLYGDGVLFQGEEGDRYENVNGNKLEGLKILNINGLIFVTNENGKHTIYDNNGNKLNFEGNGEIDFYMDYYDEGIFFYLEIDGKRFVYSEEKGELIDTGDGEEELTKSIFNDEGKYNDFSKFGLRDTESRVKIVQYLLDNGIRIFEGEYDPTIINHNLRLHDAFELIFPFIDIYHNKVTDIERVRKVFDKEGFLLRGCEG